LPKSDRRHRDFLLFRHHHSVGKLMQQAGYATAVADKLYEAIVPERAHGYRFLTARENGIIGRHSALKRYNEASVARRRRRAKPRMSNQPRIHP
jgi:hypothetical protein